MNEKTNPEVTVEETAASVDPEVTEAAEETEAIESVKETEVAEAAEETETAASAEEETAEAEDEATAIESVGEEEKPAKKKRFLQLPVLISLCIVLAALIGYFVYSAFFLREPDGRLFWSDPIIWEHEVDMEGEDGSPVKATYYYQFDKDGVFKAYAGSVEITSTYKKAAEKDSKTLTVHTNIADFYADYPVTYTISGSRILGNQVMKGAYKDDDGNDLYSFKLKQASEIKDPIELPKDFKANEKLVGTWNCTFLNNNMQLVIHDDGSISLEFIVDKNNSVKYNGIYTYDDSTINFTYYYPDNVSAPVPYSLDGDYLTFMGYTFTREGSAADNATPDQQLMLSQQQ